MNDPRLTRPALESLRTDELVNLADSLGVDIPYGLERIFIIEELLDFALGDDYFPGESLESRQDFPVAAALPKQYNISFIEVIIRDPLWAFVFWEVKAHDREIFEKDPDFGGYFLRVISLPCGAESAPAKTAAADSFVVIIGPEDAAWYLSFPPAEGCYRVELCAQRADVETVITASRPFKLPRVIEAPSRNIQQSGSQQAGNCDDVQAVYQNSLSCLSGAREFLLVRSADRQSRAKGQ
jgi:hypothetical protein